MRTGRTLTVFRCLVRGGGGISPKKAEIKKKSPPKIGGPLNPPSLPPQKLETPPKNWRPLPPKNWRLTPKNWRTPPGLTCKACWDTPPGTDLQGMLGYPPPCGQIDTHLWKYYLGQNFVSAGNKWGVHWSSYPNWRSFTNEIEDFQFCSHVNWFLVTGCSINKHLLSDPYVIVKVVYY